jgi:hypothetical protein
MKKNVFFLMLAMALTVFGAQAHAAVPAITGTLGDGVLGAGEWLNDSDPGAAVTPYPYYLRVVDGPDAHIPAGPQKAFDIDAVTLLQKVTPPFDPTGVVPPVDDGIYLLVEMIGTPTMAPLAGGGNPVILLQADFNGDGFFDLVFEHSQDVFGADVIEWSRPAASIFGPAASTVCASCTVAVGSVIEYFFPTRTGGVPHSLFPTSFVGTIRTQDGVDGGDDSVTGRLTLVPEPSTMLLFGGALLGILGVGRFRK